MKGDGSEYLNGLRYKFGVAAYYMRIKPVDERWSFLYGLALGYNYMKDDNEKNNTFYHDIHTNFSVGPTIDITKHASLNINLNVVDFRYLDLDSGSGLSANLFHGAAVNFLYYF